MLRYQSGRNHLNRLLADAHTHTGDTHDWTHTYAVAMLKLLLLPMLLPLLLLPSVNLDATRWETAATEQLRAPFTLPQSRFSLDPDGGSLPETMAAALARWPYGGPVK